MPSSKTTPHTLPAEVSRAASPWRRFVKWSAVVLGGVALLFGVLLLLVIQPGPSGEVASIRLPDGSEFVITQHCNWSAEPYTVALWSREPGRGWGWNYVDHESSRWWSTRAVYDEKARTVSFIERGTERVRVDLNTRGVLLKLDGLDGRSTLRPHAGLPQATNREPPFAFPPPAKSE